ncbi:MAG: thioredoxin family protein [Bacteroidota bacterium]
MKKHIILIIFFLSGLHIFSQGISFEHGTWAEVKALAKEKSLKIFVDAYATWCGPCKMMNSKVFKDTTVGNFYNIFFINYKLDMESDEGIAFGKKFPVEAYPTFLFFNDSAKLIKKKVGYTEASLFLEFGKGIASPEQTVVYKKKQEYAGGKKDKAFLYELCKALANAEDTLSFPALDYLSQTIDSLKSDSSFDVFKWGIHDLKSQWVQFFIKHHRYYEVKRPYAYSEKTLSLLTINTTLAAHEKNKNKLSEVILFARKIYTPEQMNDVYRWIMEQYNKESK